MFSRNTLVAKSSQMICFLLLSLSLSALYISIYRRSSFDLLRLPSIARSYTNFYIKFAFVLSLICITGGGHWNKSIWFLFLLKSSAILICFVWVKKRRLSSGHCSDNTSKKVTSPQIYNCLKCCQKKLWSIHLNYNL